ncbi:WhiB family transcriptional regulator [Streptomyces sp. NPDC096311]|uniref:WhiB family transcriptional regulator n=1 Tax=Streptomyces sp. NPDC096311 TaxID=3366083 RepID=UPI0037F1596B
MHWLEWAACSRVDPDLFFPISQGGPALTQIDETKAVCGRCAVVRQCFDWALRMGQVEGVSGGTTEIERRALRQNEARRTKQHVTTVA